MPRMIKLKTCNTIWPKLPRYLIIVSTNNSQAHNDMIRVYEAKLTEFSIPVEELGFKPMIISSKIGTSNPAGFVASQ